MNCFRSTSMNFFRNFFNDSILIKLLNKKKNIQRLHKKILIFFTFVQGFHNKILQRFSRTFFRKSFRKSTKNVFQKFPQPEIFSEISPRIVEILGRIIKIIQDFIRKFSLWFVSQMPLGIPSKKKKKTALDFQSKFSQQKAVRKSCMGCFWNSFINFFKKSSRDRTRNSYKVSFKNYSRYFLTKILFEKSYRNILGRISQKVFKNFLKKYLQDRREFFKNCFWSSIYSSSSDILARILKKNWKI